MKKIVNISVVLLFIYAASMLVGIGVIRCGCTDSQQLALAFFRSSCLCSKLVEECCPHNDQFSDLDEENECDEGECCLVLFQYIEVDQLNTSQFRDKIWLLSFFPILSVNGLIFDTKKSFVGIKNNSPPLLTALSIIYLHSQLRL